MDPTKEKDIEEEYLSSLMDLNVNSKPLINMLTMLADDNIEYAHVIVKAVEKHLAKVQPEVKLPILYLIDSIVKNVGKEYKQLFAQNIVNMFCGVFEKVNEKVREKMFNLRMTWNEVFPQTKLYALDVKTNVMDGNWPITAKIVPKSVHVNPNFLKGQTPEKPTQSRATEELRLKMEAKERELLELKQRKIELELMVTKKKIAESEKEIRVGLTHPQGVQIPSSIIPVNQHMLGPSHQHQQGRPRIAPVNSAMLASARSRDPRLSRMATNTSASQAVHTQHHPLQRVPPQVNVMMSSTITKTLPRIPKFSQSNSSPASKSSRDSERNRDPRSRRNKEKEETSKTSKITSSKDKSKSSPSSSKSSSSRPSDRKKSGSSDDSSPRKRIEDEKKLSKSPSSHHRVSHFQSKSPSKSNETESKDIDLRVVPGMESMKPDSTTNITKTNKDKLLNDLLNGENLKSSHETITSGDNEEAPMEQSPIRDVDLRFTEAGKKRSLSNEPSESEPTNKKNRSDDMLFGMKDVDLRTLGEAAVGTEKKSKIKEKADFEAVRAKLNATKDKSKVRGGIKLLDEFPSMPPGENGNAELVKRILGRKDRQQIKEAKERENSPTLNPNDEVLEPSSKQSRFNPIQEENSGKIDDVADMGNLTAAELRKSSQVPASIRKEKRKNSKWNQPAASQWPTASNPRPNLMPPINIPPSQNMMPQHFVNPWESNPMIQAMQAQTQMPLVVPQSTSHPVLNNKMRTLRLDGTKDHLLRFYEETAIIFNDVGEPHDIKFSSGQSRVVIDDQYTADLNFNDSYKSIFIESTVHQIKFGSPTRELYIDNHFYECYFNNQPTQIVLNDRLRMVRIEGNAPEVKIGQKRNDLVLGLINIVIDAEIIVPVFLDTTIQYFEFKGKIFTLQFADFFLSVIINNDPFKVEFGGHPKNYMLNGQKHFIRFTEMPENVTPGRVNMRGMRRTHLFKSCKSPPLIDPLEPINENLDIGQLVENDMRVQPQHNEPQIMMTNTLPPNVIPGIGQEAQGAPAIGVPNLDINDLLKKLVATGIIGSAAGTASVPAPETSTNAPNNNDKKAKSPEPKQDSRKTRNHQQNQLQQQHIEEKRNIIPVMLNRPETIKKRQSAIVDTLYLGIQCSSCGLRFPPEQTMKYSQHLDWHFRQNRRERDSKRRAHFRKWYYNQSDWIKYEEIEDLEEREKNFFETQQESLMDQGDDSSNARGAGGNQENVTAVSCPAGPDDANRCCEMCHDVFDHFFNEETEEWHLRSALKIDDKFYHPICYDDYKASLTLDESGLAEASADATKEEDIEMEDADDVVIKVEKDVTEGEKQTQGAVEDDDDVIMLPQEEPVVTEILDETEISGEGSKMLETSVIDDDVMIQEPKIETQLVPDDDEDGQQAVPSTSEELTKNFVVKIKEEPQDDGYEDLVNEEDAFVEVTAIDNNDLMQDEAFVNSPKAPFQPSHDENAVFDDPSMTMMPSPGAIDEVSRDNMDDDNNSRPESSGLTMKGGNRKLKIVLSSLAQTNLSNKNLNSNSYVNEQNENSNLDSINKLDSNSVELQSEAQLTDANNDQGQQEIEFQVKPQLQGVKFERNFVPVKRGFENSGLCSIM